MSPPHGEFLVICFNIYVRFHTNLFFSKMLYGVTCREFFRDCTAVFSDIKLIFKACTLFILVGSLWSREGVCPDLQPWNRLGTSFSPSKMPLVAQLRNCVLLPHVTELYLIRG